MPHSHCGESILPGVGYVRARLGARFSSAPPRSPGVPQIREKLPLICINSAKRRHVMVGRSTRPTSRVSQEGRRQLTRGEASGLAASILTATGVMTALSHSRPRLGNWRGLRIALVGTSIVALAVGLWTGLLRLGLPLADGMPGLVEWHGR